MVAAISVGETYRHSIASLYYPMTYMYISSRHAQDCDHSESPVGTDPSESPAVRDKSDPGHFTPLYEMVKSDCSI